MPPVSPRLAAATVATIATLVAAAGPATAASHHTHPSHVAKTAKVKVTKTHTTKAKVHGVVVRQAGNRLTVLAHDVTAGKRTSHNRVTTVVLAAPKAAAQHHAFGAAMAPRPGDLITATGSTTDGTTITSASVQAVSPLPARAVLGQVSAVSGTLVTLTPREEADGDHEGQDGEHGLVVDTSAATFSGVASDASGVTPGEYLVVLGEEDQGTFAAAKVFSYASKPLVAGGDVSAADQSANSLTIGGGDSDTGIAVDTTNADVVVNGNDQQTASFPTVGDKVLVVGADGSAPASTPSGDEDGENEDQTSTPATSQPIAATVVFAFNEGDHGPAGENDD